MGLFDFIRNELIDVIEWLDDSSTILVWRFPDQDHEIKMGAKLTVREGQAAIFVNEGKVADVFGPGLYSLSTQNMPVMTTLRSWKYGFESPFKAEVYFVNTRQYLDRKWGTSTPIMLRDKDFGVVRIRGFGIYALQITDPRVFWTTFVGTQGLFSTQEIEGQIRRTLVSRITTTIAELGIPALDLAANYATIAENVRRKLDPEFNKDGFSVTKLIIENISLPQKLQDALDERGTMGIIGDMGQFTQYQAAQALRDAAKQPGGMAGGAMGIGAGIQMGNLMAGSMAASQAPVQPMPVQTAPPKSPCPTCAHPVEMGKKFCPECGTPMQAAPSTTAACIKCGAVIKANAKFCGECGVLQKVPCSQCGRELSAGAKFCDECGTKV